MIEHVIASSSFAAAGQPLAMLYSKEKSTQKLSVTTLVCEAAKSDLEANQLELLLDDCDYLPDRKVILVTSFVSRKAKLQRMLATPLMRRKWLI